MKIRIITTGGTIDKIYFDQKSEYQVGEPQIAQVLRESNVSFDFEVTALLRKDSLELDDADRQRVREAVAATQERLIVVTHGTDTMVETARVLKGVPGKVVVLTGAMQPAIFRQTDAVFNISAAVTAVQLLPEGVYIAMNGRIFDPEKIRKNRQRHCFEEIAKS
ncbi:asparaginase [Desulfuromonas versatilis]|uniref:Asparaginase n=1 Tax=Desulfuromonas versatilis TaxID=2802975 RepID=A0ABN6DU46_9BACT|nr:asparaginase domain-containing protein [Desulfuromonas versatilis]BCR03630.1 asparaginase [Desulfuromonas versatilis]